MVSEYSTEYPVEFAQAVARVMADEGGTVDDPADGGGLTRFGISARAYPQLDISHLTQAEAAAIYYRDWWEKFNFAELPGPIASKCFDLAVNMGASHAIICLQRALHACGNSLVEDGALGVSTIAAAHGVRQDELLPALRSEAAGYYRTAAAESPRERKFLEGWLNRAYR